MSLFIDFQNILVFCIAQMLVLLLILVQKKYRVLPNFYLGMVFLLLILHFVYYIFVHGGYLDQYPVLAAGLKSIAFFPPVIIYLYVNLVIAGNLIYTRKQIVFMFSGFYLALLLIIPLIISSNQTYFTIYNFVVGEILFFYYFVFSFLIFKSLALFCGTEKGMFKSIFRFSQPRFNWLKIIAVMLSIHAVILFVEVNLNWLIAIPVKWYDLGMAVFLAFISYVFLYGIINYPEVIHIDKKQVGLKSPRKYTRPAISDNESNELMSRMNEYMEKYKPWLEPEFCMADFSENLSVSGHQISEVMNGLMKQNFFDYINNYRIEEFKRLLLDPDKRDDKIQFLAYDAGFNSKTAFNTAFKKFTGQTPSEYKRNTSK